jgi:hypothetical protein
MDAGGFDCVSSAKCVSRLEIVQMVTYTQRRCVIRVYQLIQADLKDDGGHYTAKIKCSVRTKRPRAWGFDWRKFASIRSPTGPKELSFNLWDA